MKSVTIAIRNKTQRIIGLLCININLDVPVSQFLQCFMTTEHMNETSSVNFASSVEDLVAQTIEKTIEEVIRIALLPIILKTDKSSFLFTKKAFLILKMRLI